MYALKQKFDELKSRASPAFAERVERALRKLFEAYRDQELLESPHIGRQLIDFAQHILQSSSLEEFGKKLMGVLNIIHRTHREPYNPEQGHVESSLKLAAPPPGQQVTGILPREQINPAAQQWAETIRKYYENYGQASIPKIIEKLKVFPLAQETLNVMNSVPSLQPLAQFLQQRLAEDKSRKKYCSHCGSRLKE